VIFAVRPDVAATASDVWTSSRSSTTALCPSPPTPHATWPQVSTINPVPPSRPAERRAASVRLRGPGQPVWTRPLTSLAARWLGTSVGMVVLSASAGAENFGAWAAARRFSR
jgi:hypothetical protein